MIKPIRKWGLLAARGVAVFTTASLALHAQNNVLQPSDLIVASSSNSPGSEGVANVIDGKPTKYLNFDSRNPVPVKPSGFAITPKVGATRVTGMKIQSANDGPERDPKIITLEGSNDDAITSFSAGNWKLIANITANDFATRFETQSFAFDNSKPFKHYRWTVVETKTANGCCMQVAEVELLGTVVPADVTQPGDPLIASSSNSPGSEGVANAIDGKPTKYLNFDSRNPVPVKPSGFIVSPVIGRTLVSGMSIQSANDGPERDPKIVTLEGSNDDTVTTFSAGNWQLVTTLTNIAFTARFETQTFLFDNFVPYKHYRWISVETATANGCCMQVAEIELLGTGAPQDVTQPGDPVFASSSNSPGSEGVANIIDGKPTKYLNFDSRNPVPIKSSGFAVSPRVGATVVTGMTIQSANDGPERDPKVVILEGSNDEALASYSAGTWTKIVQIDNATFTARFQTQEFFFANSTAYKNYRWTVIETAAANGCCMQVAEVELLAVTGVDCNKAKFTLQPANTPVLAGASATFFTSVNGPWPLRWLKNGEIIPGASAASYTTPPITEANAADKYQVEIVGCEKSVVVTAQLFTPSAVKSIGISFVGSGANGAPTLVSSNDVVGVHPQAYWNNANGGSGSLPDASADPVATFVDSSNADSSVTFTWASSGTWGAGTGSSSSTQRMLNGLVRDNPGGEPASFVFGNVPTGKHAVLIYVVAPPLVFDVVSYKLSGKTEKTYVSRVLNSDEYNAAPGFYRSTSTVLANPALANFIRFDDVEAAADGTITVAVDTITVGSDQHAGINSMQLVLNSPNPGSPPTVTADPQPARVEEAGGAILSVTATGTDLTYQWRKEGRNLPDGGHVSGATTANLLITSINKDDEGVYSVAIFNAAGSVISKNAAVRISPFDIKNGLVVHLKLNETTGTTVANTATGGTAGTVNGASSWTAGLIGNGFNLDGATYISVPNYTKAKTAISGSAWVKIPAIIQNDVAIARNAEGPLAVGGGIRVVGQFEINLVYDILTDSLMPSAAVGIGPNVARATSATAFPVGTAWHHIAFTADGAQLRLFVDGNEAARVDYFAGINPPDISYISIGGRLGLDASEPPVLGPDALAPNFLAGSLDDFALWSRGLTAESIQALYTAGKTGKGAETVVEPKPAPIGSVIEPLATGGKFGAVGAFTNFSVDSVAKVIRADLPADKTKPAFLSIKPGVTILTVKVDGNQLVITYK